MNASLHLPQPACGIKAHNQASALSTNFCWGSFVQDIHLHPNKLMKELSPGKLAACSESTAEALSRCSVSDSMPISHSCVLYMQQMLIAAAVLVHEQ